MISLGTQISSSAIAATTVVLNASVPLMDSDVSVGEILRRPRSCVNTFPVIIAQAVQQAVSYVDFRRLQGILPSSFAFPGQQARMSFGVGPCAAVDFGSLTGLELTRSSSPYFAEHCSGMLLLVVQGFSSAADLELVVSASPNRGYLTVASVPLRARSRGNSSTRNSTFGLFIPDGSGTSSGFSSLADVGSFVVYVLQYTANSNGACGMAADSFAVSAIGVTPARASRVLRGPPPGELVVSVDVTCQSVNLGIETRGLLVGGSVLTGMIAGALAIEFVRVRHTSTISSAQPVFTAFAFVAALVSLGNPLMVGLQVTGTSTLCIASDVLRTLALAASYGVPLVKSFRVLALLLMSHKGTELGHREPLTQRGQFIVLGVFLALVAVIQALWATLQAPVPELLSSLTGSDAPYLHCRKTLIALVLQFGLKVVVCLGGIYSGVATYNVNRCDRREHSHCAKLVHISPSSRHALTMRAAMLARAASLI